MEKSQNNYFQKYLIAWVLIGIGICGMIFLIIHNFQATSNSQEEIPITISSENHDLPHQTRFDTVNTLAINNNNQAEKFVSNPVKKLAKSVEIATTKIFHEKVSTDKFATSFGQIEPMIQLDTLQQITPIGEIQLQTTPR